MVARLGVQIELVDEAVVEPHALAGQAVDVRRLVDPPAVGADGVGRVIVGHDEEDVRAVGGGSRTGQNREQDRQNRQAHRLDSRSGSHHVQSPRTNDRAMMPPAPTLSPEAKYRLLLKLSQEIGRSLDLQEVLRLPARIGAHGRRVRRGRRVRPQPARPARPGHRRARDRRHGRGGIRRHAPRRGPDAPPRRRHHRPRDCHRPDRHRAGRAAESALRAGQGRRPAPRSPCRL